MIYFVSCAILPFGCCSDSTGFTDMALSTPTELRFSRTSLLHSYASLKVDLEAAVALISEQVQQSTRQSAQSIAAIFETWMSARKASATALLSVEVSTRVEEIAVDALCQAIESIRSVDELNERIDEMEYAAKRESEAEEMEFLNYFDAQLDEDYAKYRRMIDEMRGERELLRREREALVVRELSPIDSGVAEGEHLVVSLLPSSTTRQHMLMIGLEYRLRK